MAIATMRVPTIFTAVDRFSGVINTMQRNVGSFGTAAEGASQRIGRKMTALGSRMLLTSSIIGASFIKPVNDAIQFEDQMGKINTILHETPTGLGILAKQVRELAKESVSGLDNITESYYDLLSAGVKQPNVMGILKAAEKLSIGGIGTMQDATELILAKQGAFASENLTAQQSANQAQKIMKHGKGTLAQLSPTYSEGAVPFGLVGGTSAQYDAMIAGLTAVNQTQSSAISQIGLMTRSAAKGAGAFKKIFKQLNITSFSKLVARNKKDVLLSFAQILKKGEELGYNQDQIWGRAGASVGIGVLLKNQKGLNQYTTAYNDILNETNNELNKAYAERSDNRRSQLKRLTNQLLDLSITIGDALLPALTQLSKQMKPVLESTTRFLKENPGAVTGILKLVGAFAALGAVFTVFGWMAKIYSFFAWFRTLTWVVTLIEGIGVSFSLAAGAIGISSLALGGWIALIIGGFVLLGVLVNDVINHFDEWGRTILALASPLGTMLNFIIDIYDNWSYLTKAFQEGGITKAFSALGDILKNSILDSLIRITNIMSRIPGFGGLKGISNELENAKVSMYDKSIPTGFMGNSVPAVWSNPTPENLSGKQNNFGSMNPFMDFQNKGELLVNVKVDGGEVTGYDPSKLNGIPVKLESTKTAKKG
jgi:TP901 family phage tail tape measure protein